MDLSSAWPYIKATADARLRNNITTRHVSSEGDVLEVMGCAGEFAAKRFLGLPPELHTHFDKGVDFVYRNISVDVKATIWSPKLEFRYLQWPHWKPMTADVVLLTAVLTDTMAARVVGFATRWALQGAAINLMRPQPCHEVPVPALRKGTELKNNYREILAEIGSYKRQESDLKRATTGWSMPVRAA